MVDSLQGHKLDKMKAVYVDKLDLRMRNEFVQKITYEGLDLSHLYVSERPPYSESETVEDCQNKSLPRLFLGR